MFACRSPLPSHDAPQHIAAQVFKCDLVAVVITCYGTAKLGRIECWGSGAMLSTTSNAWAVEPVTITVGMLTGEAVRQILLLAASVIRTR
jgi:hypothetical protein